MTSRPQTAITTPVASPEEAAAIAAAAEQFLHDTAPEPVTVATSKLSAWKRAALAEGVIQRPDLQA